MTSGTSRTPHSTQTEAAASTFWRSPSGRAGATHRLPVKPAINSYAKYVARVGALAVALGIGGALAAPPGLAWADETTSSQSSDSNSTGSESGSESTGSGAGSTGSGSGSTGSGSESTGSGSGSTDPSTQSGTDPGTSSSGSGGSTSQTTTTGNGVTISSSGGAHTSGAENEGSQTEGQTSTGTEDEQLPEQPVEEEVLPETPPETPTPSTPEAQPPAGSHSENGSKVQQFVHRIAGHLTPDSPRTTTTDVDSGDLTQARLLTATTTESPTTTAADQLAPALTLPQLPTSGVIRQELKTKVVTCICGVLQQGASLIGNLLGGIANPGGGGGAPMPENPVLNAVLAFVRRFSATVLEIPVVNNIFSTVKSIAAEQYQRLLTCGQPIQGLPEDLERTILIDGLTEPTEFRFLPSDDPDNPRIIIAQKDGTVLLYENGALNPTPVVVLPTLSDYSERGLAGIEVDPDFATNGYIYVSYTSTSNHVRLSRLTMEGDTADLSTELVLVESTEDAGVLHHGGEVKFGPDDMLYWAVGDNGESTNAQDLSNIHGKILRIDPTQCDANGCVPISDNPFVDNPEANPHIYAYGFRNPFRFTWTDGGQMLVGDVGNDAWEELNLVTKGGNYGWPGAEGVCTENCGNFINPIYTYPHTPPPTTSGSITSVMIYTGDTLGPEHVGKVFIADYSLGWIKELTFDETYSSFISERTFDGAAGTTVKLAQGPDGNIYQLTIYPGQLSVIAPSGGNRAPSAVITATPSNGPNPLTVQFSSSGSSDPEGSSLTHSWDFGDGNTSTQANPTHTFNGNGAYDVTLTVTDDQGRTGTTTQRIVVGSVPPEITDFTVTTPGGDGHYNAGDTVTFSATAIDPDTGQPLPESAYEWNVVFHHAEHIHPFRSNIIGSSGEVEIPTDNHNVANSFYEVTLTVTDSTGLKTTQTMNVVPNTTQLTITASDPDATFTVDGQPHKGSFSELAVVGVVRVVDVPQPQFDGSDQLVFVGWSDGGAQSHTITTPDDSADYQVNFNRVPAPATVV